jgi:DeoR family transcriptional regulator, aga operon transcriptional repressor
MPGSSPGERSNRLELMRRKEPKMLADERRRAILQLVRKKGSVAIEDLVRHFNVSAVTLRSDLGQLAREGALVRSYGGAMVHDEHTGDYPLTVKNTRNQTEKTRIAAAAARLVKSHQTVILDSGSTSAAVARALRQANLDSLTVITHALNIAQEFLNSSKVSVIMIGGIMRHVSGSFVGPQAEQLLRPLHADHFFLGIDGLDNELDLSTPDLLEAQLNTVMMRISNETTVIADASKIGRRSLSVIGNLTGVRRLITDTRVSPEMVTKFREAGVEVILV